MIFTSTLIWYQTHRPKTNTQIYINPTCYVRTTYTQWIICRYKNLLYRGSQCLCFSKVTRLWKSYICWLHSTRRSPSSETKNTDWNGINEQNVHTTHTDKDNLRFRKGWLVWACNNPFFRTPSYGTILNPLPFFGKFRKLHPPPPPSTLFEILFLLWVSTKLLKFYRAMRCPFLFFNEIYNLFFWYMLDIALLRYPHVLEDVRYTNFLVWFSFNIAGFRCYTKNHIQKSVELV